MANERLRSTIASAGLSFETLAETIGVDPKTVTRWVAAGRLPHPTHRRAAAKAMQRDETYLWPELLSDARAAAAGEAEVIRVYPTRGVVPLELWLSLITGATKELGLLAYAGLFLLDNNPDITERIIDRAAAGVRVRILLADPTSAQVRARGHEEGIGEGLRGRVEVVQAYLAPALGTAGVEVRRHTTTLYNSIFRSDGSMLVNMHMYGSGAPANPVMHLRQVPGGRLFDSYQRSFDKVWDVGVPVTSFDEDREAR